MIQALDSFWRRTPAKPVTLAEILAKREAPPPPAPVVRIYTPRVPNARGW